MQDPMGYTQWVGFDLDGTLAHFDWDEWQKDSSHIGEPINNIKQLLLMYISSGVEVRICTARACDPKQTTIVKKWLKKNNLPALVVTNSKDYGMIRLYDDKAVQVEFNTGVLIE